MILELQLRQIIVIFIKNKILVLNKTIELASDICKYVLPTECYGAINEFGKIAL